MPQAAARRRRTSSWRRSRSMRVSSVCRSLCSAAISLALVLALEADLRAARAMIAETAAMSTPRSPSDI